MAGSALLFSAAIMRFVQPSSALQWLVLLLTVHSQGRVTGAIWGGSGVIVGMKNYVGLQIAFVGIGSVLFSTLWRDLKAKTG